MGEEKVADVDQICEAFEGQAREGGCPRIEDFVKGLPAEEVSAVTWRLILLEMDLRRRVGQSPDPVEYAARFPQLQDRMPSSWIRQQDSADVTEASTFTHGTSLPSKETGASAAISRVGRYRLESLLGSGGFGEVWRAFDTELHRCVAVKLLREDRLAVPEARDAFLTEGRKLAQLRHRGIVTVYDVGREQERGYIVSELAEGGTLAERLRRGPLEPEVAAKLVAEVAEALHHAHLRGLVHRDVKPKNILLDEQDCPRLADFGLAVTEEEQLFEVASTVGTFAYMSPELIRGESHHVDARTDIYSLGVVLYQSLTGRLPFVARSYEQYREQILQREVRPPRTIDDRIPPALEAVCLRCLSRDLRQRFTTALDLANELRNVLPESVEKKRAVKASPWRSPAAALLGMLCTLLALGALLWSAGVVLLDKPTADELSAPPTLEGRGATVLEQGKWNLLLDRPPPILIWPKYSRDSDIRHVPEQRELWVFGGHLGMLELGELDAPNYIVQANFVQQRWAGEVGLFLGYHEDFEVGPDVRRFHAVWLRQIPRTLGEPPRLLLAWRSRAVDRFGNLLEGEEVPLKMLPLPAADEQMLEISVIDNRLGGVRWAGEDLPLPDLPPMKERVPDGKFGIVIGRSAAIIRDASVFIPLSRSR